LFVVGKLCSVCTRTSIQSDSQRHRRENRTNRHYLKQCIIAFFATWCKPCNRELTSIDEVYDDWQQETGVRLVAVSIDQAQNVNKVKPMVDQNGWRYDVLLDANGEFRRSLGIQSVPYTVLLDGQGKIVYKHNGYTDGAEVELYKKVKEAAGK